MEALDTTLYEEGTQIPLNPSTTSGQVRHKDTTVEKTLDALEADGSVTTARLADGAVTSAKIDAAYTEKVSAAIDAKLDKAAFLTDAEVNDIWDNN